MTNTKGKLIAAIGLPGSGKSSLISLVAKKYGGHCFLEPEENDWTDAVHMRDQVGHITALTWFRATRVPMLYKADSLRKAGEIVFIDSYYDKLISKYIGKKGMEWLISPIDRYFHIAKSLSLIDYDELPNADCLVSFRVSQRRWDFMLNKRNRDLDKSSALQDTFHTQEYFIEAAEAYCKEMDIPHLVFDNETDGLNSASEDIVRKLVNAGVI